MKASETSPSPPPSSARPRRRSRRRWLPPGADERSAWLAQVAQRAVPGADFFLQTALAALVWVLALMSDSLAGLVLGAVIAPFFSPALGLSLGVAMGAGRYALRMLGALAVGLTLAFLIGLLGGAASLAFAPQPLTHTPTAAHLAWGNLLLLSVGTGWAVWALARRPQQGIPAGAALAYTLPLPLTAAGFGLVSGQEALWPAGAKTFAVHLAWASALGLGLWWALGLRPSNLLRRLLGVTALLGSLALAALGWFTEPSPHLPFHPLALPTLPAAKAPAPLPPTAKPSLTSPASPMPTATATPVPATATPTPSPTAVPSPTATWTPSPSPTPIVAFIAVRRYNGALIRQGPGFDQPQVGGALNGTRVIVLEAGHEADHHLWAKIYIPSEDLTGWIVQDLLIFATPAPRW